jgi:hypothetical protein
MPAVSSAQMGSSAMATTSKIRPVTGGNFSKENMRTEEGPEERI